MGEPADFDWKPVQRQRTHEQVLAQVEEQILRGRLRPGDRLPAERQLADTLGVSRSAVREALRVMESMGVVAAGTGSGANSGSIIVGEGTPALSTLLRLHLALSSFSQREVMEVRVQLERWAVHEAAARAEPSDLDQLHRLVSQMRGQQLASARFNELDTAFHVALADVSGNALLATLMRAIRDAVQREMIAVFDELEDRTMVMRMLVEQHAGILDAVSQGEGDRAATLVQKHIEDFYHGPTAQAGASR